MNQIKNLRGRLNGLEEKERRLKEQLEKMEEEGVSTTASDQESLSSSTSEPDSSSAAANNPANIPSHINFTDPQSDS